MGCGPSCFCARPHCDYLKTKTTAFLSKFKEVGTETPQTAASCSCAVHCFSTSPKWRRFMELQNSIGQCLRRFLGFRKNRIDMQNLRWRNLEALCLSGFVLLECPSENTDASATHRRISGKFPTYCVRFSCALSEQIFPMVAQIMKQIF